MRGFRRRGVRVGRGRRMSLRRGRIGARCIIVSRVAWCWQGRELMGGYSSVHGARTAEWVLSRRDPRKERARMGRQFEPRRRRKGQSSSSLSLLSLPQFQWELTRHNFGNSTSLTIGSRGCRTNFRWEAVVGRARRVSRCMSSARRSGWRVRMPIITRTRRSLAREFVSV